MSKTRHIGRRMSDSAIRDELLEVIKQFAVGVGHNSYTLSKEGCMAALQELENLRKAVVGVRGKNGMVLVRDDETDTEITIFRIGSYSFHSKSGGNR